MSQTFDLPLAAEAAGEERAAFIRRTYAHLAGAILAFTGLTAGLLSLPNVESIVGPMMGNWWIVFIGWMVASWVAQYWASSNTSIGLQYLGLALYVVAEAFIFLPLLFVARYFSGDPNIIPTAGVLTLAIFGGLTAGVLVTKKDFSFMGPIISIASFVLLGVIICAALFGTGLGLWFAFAVVALASGAILYNTSALLYQYRTDQHVAASLQLFASVALLFYYILLILLSSSRD